MKRIDGQNGHATYSVVKKEPPVNITVTVTVTESFGVNRLLHLRNIPTEIVLRCDLIKSRRIQIHH